MFETPNEMMTTEEFLAFVEKLAKHGTVAHVQAGMGNYSVSYAMPDSSAAIAEAIKAASTTIARAQGNHLKPV